VIRVIPSPMLSALVVVEKYPLHALKVSEEELMQLFLAFDFL